MRFVLAFAILSISGVAARGDDASVDYARDVKPILRQRCYACHGGLKQESGLRLDTAASIRAGGDSGAAVVAEMPQESLLLERVSDPDPATRMPPEGEPLEPDEIATIKAWIAAGAPAPEDEQPESDPRDHWSFRPPVRAELPASAQSATAGADHSNPIDAFLAADHARLGLAPQPPAEKGLLLRRVYLDLVGLPPTREQLHAFVADESPEAYERVVDELLASPQYGERWARHWMDVWRYSDWFGRRMVPDVWNSAPQIWRWRDWIVRSLNDDQGYDRMVAEVLAGDELAPEDDEAGYATGYLIRNWYALNPNDWMRANVEHTGKAFLGLTFNCAHCHDHKYDPIAQDDYFRLRAFFEPIGVRQDRVAGEADPGAFQEYEYSTLRKIVRLGAVRIFDKQPEAPTWFYTGGDERNRVAERGSIAPGVPAFLTSEPVAVQPVSLPSRAWYPNLRPAIQETILAELRAAIEERATQLAEVRKAADAVLPDLRAKLAAAENAFAEAQDTARRSDQSGALAGRQSLVLDATAGRRIVQNGLAGLAALDDGAVLSFQLRIVKDAHVNFQLAKDVVQGLTAGYVGFEAGRIVSYQPGSFTEFEVGRYDLAAGQNRFDVTLRIETAADRCLLSVRSVADDKRLVEAVPVALNGWNPVGDATKAIAFDAHAGSIAAIDEVALHAPASASGDATAGAAAPARLAYFDFEPPGYPDQADAVGIDGWQASSFCQAPARSYVATAIDNEELASASGTLHAAQRAVDVHELQIRASDAQHAAAQAELAGTTARLAADCARFGAANGGTAVEKPNVDELARTASRLYREAAVRNGEAAVLAAEQALVAAEAKPAEDANRQKELDTAATQLTAARKKLDEARTALDDEAQALAYPPVGPTYPQTSTGRRLALARWITSRDNPLTARVAVNHIWMRHFHRPLVASVYDFGRNGARPTHPELLDWLAVELMESGWSMKRLHRLIVTSEAYRRASHAAGAGEANLANDPENKMLWRMNVGRMEAEVVRDSLLAAAGQLDRTMGGQELENSEALATRRRSLYYSCHPEVDGRSQFGALFDAPEPGDCYRRTETVIPQQALALTNSELVHEMSDKLAAALWQSLTPEAQAAPREFITAAYEQILSRQPTDEEAAACAEFLATDEKQERARAGLIRALLNHNDFIAIR